MPSPARRKPRPCRDASRARRTRAPGRGLRLLGEIEPGFDHRVGIERDRLDAFLEEPAREIRVIAGTLAADADVLLLLAAGRDRHVQERLDRVVALVEQM